MSESVSTPVIPKPIATPAVDRAQFWRETIADFTTSGLSVREFCRRRGLHEKRFYTWRRNLGLSPCTRSTPAPTNPTPNPTFVPVRILTEATAEVILPAGLTLRVPISADPTAIARLVTALRGSTC